jgi:hypothetical protein
MLPASYLVLGFMVERVLDRLRRMALVRLKNDLDVHLNGNGLAVTQKPRGQGQGKQTEGTAAQSYGDPWPQVYPCSICFPSANQQLLA